MFPLNVIPENPTLIWLMSTTITALVGVVVYMYKSNEKREESKEKIMLKHSSDLQSLLEKSLILFGGIEKNIIEMNNDSKDKIISAISNGNKSIVDEIRKTIDKTTDESNR